MTYWFSFSTHAWLISECFIAHDVLYLRLLIDLSVYLLVSFLIVVTKYKTRSNSREKGFISQLTVQGCSVSRGWSREQELEAVGEAASTTRKPCRMDARMCAQLAFCFVWSSFPSPMHGPAHN